MAYRDFKMDDLEQKFHIREIGKEIFNPSKIVRVQPSDKLLSVLEDAELIPLSTEKALSEQVIAPILVEMKRRNPMIEIYSGEIINGDKKLGLNGEIDFIFSKQPRTIKPKSPIFCVTESKLSLVERAVPQAVAQMLGVRLFNQNKGVTYTTIHGIVTDGTTWLILQLNKNDLYVDSHRYSRGDLPLLLGVLQSIIDYYKEN